MSFTEQDYIIVFPKDHLDGNKNELRGAFGESLCLKPKNCVERIDCVAGHKDRDGSDDIRTGIIGESATGTLLKNGKEAYIGRFPQSFIDAIGSEPLLAGVEILTPEEYQALLPNDA